MNEADRAQVLELADYVETQRRAIMTLPMAPSAKYCTDPHCGDEIPEERRIATPGVLFCTECQARRERLSR